ncbi:MAG: prepilin peptidase [Spirochaetes bacterium]|nr:prepilin peptidase [Spirochaetota bacterium]
MTEVLLFILLFLGGSAFGSFYFTLYLRFTDSRFESVFKILVSPSSCPFCGEKISVFFLTPVLGYFFSGGKCGKCGKQISLQYLFSEILSGIVFVLVFSYFKGNWMFIPVFLVTISSVTLSLVDLKKRIIPDIFIIMVLLFSIPVVLFQPVPADNLYGFLFMTGVFGAILLLFPGSFGGGDFKYAAVIGLFLGLELSVLAFEVSVISGAVAGTIYGYATGRGLRAKIPFGPFLAFGLFVSIFYGSRIILMYHGLFR